jgi:elongation factor G
VAGHAGAGKTSLIEAMLHLAGATRQKGSIIEKNTVGDFEKEEKEHGFSIYSKVMHCDHAGARINFIDTPGTPDLVGQAIMCMPAVETVAVVVSATAGIEVNTRRVMEAAKARNLPRAIIVNHIDAEKTDLPGLLAQLQETFGTECLPITLPQANNTAVAECLLNRAGQSDFSSVESTHTALLDHIVEMDDQLMEKYLGGDEPNYQAMHAPFEKAMDTGHIVPVLFTSAKTGVGVRELLDAIAKHFPNPMEGNLRPFMTGEGDDEKPFEYAEDTNRPLLAHVFKVTTDPFVGKLALFRVHEGVCKSHANVFIGHNKKPVKLAHLFHLQGKQHLEVQELIAGDIGCVSKIDEIHLGDVLHDDHALDSVHHKREAYPTPMYGLAVTPKTRGDEQKIGQQLSRLADEDPTFKFEVDRQTHELVIHGLGEMHLRLVLEKLASRGMHVDTRPPKISYRETIVAAAEGHYRHKKQTGGSGQFGEVYLRVEPLPRGTGFEFANEVFGGTIPGQYIPAVEKGVKDLLDQGVLTGNPLVDVRVTVYDGKHHPVDSKEVAFRTAGKFAFKEAVLKARPTLLEPIVSLEITAPENFLGAITADLSSKRARISTTDVLPGAVAVVKATAPLSELMMYATQLKSMTSGQGSFVMDLSHYDPAPPQVQSAVAAGYKPKEEED